MRIVNSCSIYTNFFKSEPTKFSSNFFSTEMKFIQIGKLSICYTSTEDFIENFCQKINEECPNFLNKELVLKTLNSLKKTQEREILGLIQDSGNDHDDQKAGVVLSIMMALGSINPNFFRFIGISNPEGVDANGTLKKYLDEYNTPADDKCFLTSRKATTLYTPQAPFSPQSQKKDVLGELPRHYDIKDVNNDDTLLVRSMVDNGQKKTLFVGASSAGVTDLFFKKDAFSKAVSIAYEMSIQELFPETPKEDITKEQHIKVHATFQEKLKKELADNISFYIRPEFIDLKRSDKLKRLDHLLIQSQGAVSADPNAPGQFIYPGQNQKFCSLYETNGQLIDLDNYEDKKKKNVSTVGVLDAKLLHELLRPIFGFTLNYCGENPKIVITGDMQEKLGKNGLDVLADFVVKNYMKDNMLASYPSILLNAAIMEPFFPGILSSQPGLSKSFSANAHPFRTLMNLYSSAQAAGIPIQKIVMQRNENPKDIIETSIKTISDHISNKDTILHDKNASLEEKIHFFFDTFYDEKVIMTPDWDPKTPSAKNFAPWWKALTGDVKYPTISDTKTHLINMVKNNCSSPNFTEAFCLELLQLHADGICAQQKCIQDKVKGTQEECYLAVSKVCNPKFTSLFSYAVTINPFDLQNLLQGLSKDIDFETLTKLLTIKDFFHSFLKVEKSLEN